MAEFYPELTEELERFISQQRIFFVASAPPGGGRVNLSPKGYKSLVVLDSRTVAYIDYPGSGNETARHIKQGGSVTLMFCSFEAKPLVLRLFCRGEVLSREEAERRGILARGELEVPDYARQVILLHIEEVMTSCGYGVPYFRYLGDRETLREWCRKKLAQGELEKYLR